MASIFKKIFNKEDVPHFFGAVDPGRIDQLPKLSEVAGAIAPVVWKPLDLSKLPQYKVRNQNGASACVAFTIAFLASVMYFRRTGNWVDFSPSWVYSQRSNKPQEGMIGTDAFGIAAKGMLPDVLLPSDDLPEASVSSPKIEDWYSKVADVFALGDATPVVIPKGDIEALASVIQETGKAVMVWFDFNNGEWGQVPKANAVRGQYRHSVPAIPPRNTGDMSFGIYNGEKAVVIQDQWGNIANTIGGKRIITESWYKERNVVAMYAMRFKFDGASNPKPKYDGSISSLQDCLAYDGVFPSNVTARGTLGPITVDAIKKFQAKYGLEVVGTVGPKTTTLLKTMFP